MANFPARPFQFVPMGARIERGSDHRLARNMMVVDDPPLSHERYAIVTAVPPVPDHQKQLVLDEVVRIMVEDFHLEVPGAYVYPIGVGMVAFANVVLRDQFIQESPHQLDPVDEEMPFSFVPHDEALNMRLTTYGPAVWILYVGFPYDYQTYHYLHRSISWEAVGTVGLFASPCYAAVTGTRTFQMSRLLLKTQPLKMVSHILFMETISLLRKFIRCNSITGSLKMLLLMSMTTLQMMLLRRRMLQIFSFSLSGEFGLLLLHTHLRQFSIFKLGWQERDCRFTMVFTQLTICRIARQRLGMTPSQSSVVLTLVQLCQMAMLWCH